MHAEFRCTTVVREFRRLRNVKDKGVLITGAGRGIGKRLAIGFANHGARVALLARSKAELDLANLEIEHAGGVSLRIRADVRDYEQLAAAVERMKAHYGRLDVLICAAALQGPIGPLLSIPGKAWAETIETNLHRRDEFRPRSSPAYGREALRKNYRPRWTRRGRSTSVFLCVRGLESSGFPVRGNCR